MRTRIYVKSPTRQIFVVYGFSKDSCFRIAGKDILPDVSVITYSVSERNFDKILQRLK